MITFSLRNHLTTILPTFRLASACSDEDMLSSNENDEQMNRVNASSDECLSPAYHATANNKSTMQQLQSSSKSSVHVSASKPRVTLQQKGIYLVFIYNYQNNFYLFLLFQQHFKQLLWGTHFCPKKKKHLHI